MNFIILFSWEPLLKHYIDSILYGQENHEHLAKELILLQLEIHDGKRCAQEIKTPFRFNCIYIMFHFIALDRIDVSTKFEVNLWIVTEALIFLINMKGARTWWLLQDRVILDTDPSAMKPFMLRYTCSIDLVMYPFIHFSSFFIEH